MMHPMEFMRRTPNNPDSPYSPDQVNQTQINYLRTVLARVRQHGLRVVTIQEIPAFFDPTHPYRCNGTQVI